MISKTLRKPLLVLFGACALVVLLASGVASQDGHVEEASAASGGAAMSLHIVDGSGGFCVGSACTAGVGASFTLSVNVDSAPANDYILTQSFIYYGDYDPTASEDGAGANTCSDSIDNGGGDGRDRFDTDCVTTDLTYNPTPVQADEFFWPDMVPGVRDIGPGYVYHGGLTGIFPPLLGSDYEGPFVQFEMSCPGSPVLTTVALLSADDPFADTSGALFLEPDFTNVVPKVDSITVNCVAPQASPGDTDGDGCSDVDENGSDPTIGGDRDWLNPWDYYDVNGDGIIDLPNDILGVILHQGTAPGPPYDVQYDRGPWTGANSWNGTGAPDGVIDGDIDTAGVLAQYGHRC